MEIRHGFITFGSDSGRGPRDGSSNVVFSTPLTRATAILTGFDVKFSSSHEDRRLGNLDIRLTTGDPTGTNTVPVTATLGLRDWSDHYDDPYEGIIYFAVIAE